MAKFAPIAKGRKARKTVSFPDLDGEVQKLDLRVLVADDYAEIDAAAGRYAREQGAEAKQGDGVYDFARYRETVLRACVDTESSVDKPEPFFESMAQIRRELDEDRVLYLAA